MVATDDLSAPLGLDKVRDRQRSFPGVISHALLGVLSLFVVAVGGWAMIADDPFGGEPIAVAPASPSAYSIGKRPANPAPALVAETPASSGPSRYDGPAVEAPPAAAGKTITIIDGSSGKRHEIVLPVSDNR